LFCSFLPDWQKPETNREEEVLGGLVGSERINRENMLTPNSGSNWRLVELEDGYSVVTNLNGKCLEANPDGDVNESDCVLDDDYQLWQMNNDKEDLLNKATGKCLDSEDKRIFKTFECY